MISEEYPEVNADVYYLRVRVTNDGNVAAKNVEVFASELKTKRAGEGYVAVTSFLPMNLVWSQIGGVYVPQIAPKMHRHCDVARVIDPALRREFKPSDKTWDEVDPQAPILDICTHVKVNTLPHLVPAGTYRLTIIAAGANTEPVTATIEITLKGWYASTERMLTDGIGVEIVK